MANPLPFFHLLPFSLFVSSFLLRWKNLFKFQNFKRLKKTAVQFKDDGELIQAGAVFLLNSFHDNRARFLESFDDLECILVVRLFLESSGNIRISSLEGARRSPQTSSCMKSSTILAHTLSDRRTSFIF